MFKLCGGVGVDCEGRAKLRATALSHRSARVGEERWCFDYLTIAAASSGPYKAMENPENHEYSIGFGNRPSMNTNAILSSELVPRIIGTSKTSPFWNANNG